MKERLKGFQDANKHIGTLNIAVLVLYTAFVQNFNSGAIPDSWAVNWGLGLSFVSLLLSLLGIIAYPLAYDEFDHISDVGLKNGRFTSAGSGCCFYFAICFFGISFII